MGHNESVTFWNEVEDIFAAVLTAKDSDRPTILQARCGDRTELRTEVESLLAAHARAGMFISAPAFATTDSETTFAGDRVGAFRLTSLIARGGMGEVFKAERADEEFPQQVAVKVIAARLTGADTLRRFRTERRILAALQHPNIVGLLDGGITDSGQPYFVMEYVDGLTITDFCTGNRVTLEQRLRLFQQLCAAVDYAHRHLIVHRDLKPANVIVTAERTVKVLDFGIAKLLDEENTASAGTSPLLTPMTINYASPEQIRGVKVTTAADVYALGVMLYELLSGSRPYETRGKTLEEVFEIVLNREVLRPSAVRGDSVPYSRRALTGDLDAIVLRAMAKDPSARYASAAELSDDVTRYLAGAPIVAAPPSLTYLMRKTVGRHRAAFGVAAVSLLALIAALGSALWAARVASNEREHAVQRLNDVRELAGALIFKIHDEVAPLPGSTPVRRTLVSEGLKFLERLERDSAGDAALQLELARAYIRLGDVQGRISAANLGDRQGAQRSYRRAIALAADARRSTPTAEPLAILVQGNLALSETLDPAAARDAVRRAHALASEWYARDRVNVQAIDLLARTTFHLALKATGADSLRHWLETERLYKSLLTAQPGNLEWLRNVALTQKYLASHYQAANDHAKALAHSQTALELDRKRLAARPEDRTVLIDVAISMASVAFSQARLGQHEAAVAGYRESLAIREKISNADPKDIYARGRVAFVNVALADVYARMGQTALARQHGARALALLEPLLGQGQQYWFDQASAFLALGKAEEMDGRIAASCAWYVKSREAYQRADLILASRYPELVGRIDAAAAGCKGR